MSIEVRLLMKLDRNSDWQDDGAILVCNTSGRPLNLPVETFSDAEEAETFLTWCFRQDRGSRSRDPRSMSAEELEIAVETWRTETPPAPAQVVAKRLWGTDNP